MGWEYLELELVTVWDWLMEVGRWQNPSKGRHIWHTNGSNRSVLCRGGKANGLV